jgi:hypothetical protein
VSPADLDACGFSSKAVRRRIDEGVWHRIGGAIVLGPLPPSPDGSSSLATRSDDARSWILHFTFGPRTRISGILALRRAGWLLSCTAYVVVVADKPNRQLPGVTVLRRPDTVGVLSHGALRFVPAREALADCLSVLPTGAAAALLDTALQKRHVRPDVAAADLSARLGRGRRDAAGLRRLRDRAVSGSRSEAEQRMARLLRRSGTGPWVPNHAFRGPDGDVMAEIDFAHLGLRIAIEVDGRAFHSDRQAFERDRWRQNVLTLGGWLVLRFTWEQITQRPHEVMAVIRAAVAQRAA